MHYYKKTIIGFLWLVITIYWIVDLIIFLKKLLSPSYPLGLDSGLIGTISWDAIDILMSLTCASILIFNWKKAHKVVMLIALYFAFYGITYLLLGGEGAFIIRILTPSYLILLCIVTIMTILQEKK